MTTKRCIKCHLNKSITEFNKQNHSPSGLDYRCKSCTSIQAYEITRRGLNVLLNLANSLNHCGHCQRSYCYEDWHYFEFDHIDINLKKHNKETNSRWVASHEVEFIERVAPNLQLLCVKCHKIKSISEMKLGGSAYQKIFGDSAPAQVIQRDLTLFDSPLTLESDDLYTSHNREGDWITVRDIDGNLVSYEPYSNYIKLN